MRDGLRKCAAPVAVVLVFVAARGCARPLVQGHNVIEIQGAEYDRVYDASMEILREYGFTIDRHDYRHGVITTRPVGSPTVLEPWGRHNRTADDAVASTLTHQRRRVTVNLEPKQGSDGGEAFQMRIESHVERRQTTRTYMTGSAAGHHVVSTLHATPGELSSRGVQDQYWQPVRRDGALEQQLLAAIIRRSLLM